MLYTFLLLRDLQNCPSDTDIRDDNKDKRAHDHNRVICEGQKLIDGGIRAGECQQWLNITKEVVDDIVSTERKAAHE